MRSDTFGFLYDESRRCREKEQLLLRPKTSKRPHTVAGHCFAVLRSEKLRLMTSESRLLPKSKPLGSLTCVPIINSPAAAALINGTHARNDNFI